MITHIPHQQMGHSERDWLHSTYHFSFAEYYNPLNIHYGPLRVVNDDTIDPGGGFDIHFHDNMEIITYIIDGILTHRDHMGNERTLTRGQVQYMCAGTGILHSEYNHRQEPLRLLQIWIIPDQRGLAPAYIDQHYPWADRLNCWLPIASGPDGPSALNIQQDVTISAALLEAGHSLSYQLDPQRQAYLILIEGSGAINCQPLSAGDAAEIRAERALSLSTESQAHFILFDMAADT